MKIRAITYFLDPSSHELPTTLHRLSHLSRDLKHAFQNAGIEVQTCRVATTPFPLWLNLASESQMIRTVQELEQEVLTLGFDYLGVGPALLTHASSYAAVIPILASTSSTFIAAQMAEPDYGISLQAIRASASIIHQAASLTSDGFANLRFAALANVPPGAPFFPAAYHPIGNPPALAFAIESADVVLEVFSQEQTWDETRQALLGHLETFANRITSVVTPLLDSRVVFRGFDFSPAPFPSPSCSIGAALERLGASRLGTFGSLSAAAFLAETLSRGRWPRSGFNGLMLPVLEDTVLAQRAAEGTLSLKDLLLFSAVCGTGLDTVPLPGEASPDQLMGLLADLAFLSTRLRKPLTARLMPIPGKKAGDAVSFDFAYFAPGGVMALPSSPLCEALWFRDEKINLENFSAPA